MVVMHWGLFAKLRTAALSDANHSVKKPRLDVLKRQGALENIISRCLRLVEISG